MKMSNKCGRRKFLGSVTFSNFVTLASLKGTWLFKSAYVFNELAAHMAVLSLNVKILNLDACCSATLGIICT